MILDLGFSCPIKSATLSIRKVTFGSVKTYLLSDLVGVALSIGSVVTSIIFVGAGGTRDLNVSRAKLGVIEEERGLRSSLLLEGDCRALSASSRCDLDTCDLATEEVSM
jgi:hypothetical protein